MATATALDELRKTIWTCPIIDNHAHNLLRLHQVKSADFLSATSEAGGEALQDHVKALPHFRALRQLSKLYGLPADVNWDVILKRRKDLLDTDPKALVEKCLAGTHAILIDDGLEGSLQKYSWHSQFTTAPCKRIVRIEAIAASILSAIHQQGKLPVGVAIADEEACQLAWIAFITAFEQAIAAYLEDDEVVGFKSVICYRTGLDIEVGRDVEVNEAGSRSFRRYYLPHCTISNFRVQTKGMNDALVISTSKLIEAYAQNNSVAKPFQFHTGLGDNDISLLDSNPACMQPLIKAFPGVPFVLLHSSYPFTREAGYFATVYKNVYLDIGEVFPMVSRDGQEQILRQALEITPTSKILWSTDGHHHPETYWLANEQGREVIEKVFCKYVIAEDWTINEATQAARDIFFNNSNLLYNLGFEYPRDNAGMEERAAESQELVAGTEALALENEMPETHAGRPSAGSLSASSDLGSIDYVFVQWLDYMAQIRSRWLPTTEFVRLTSPPGAERLAISKGNLFTTPNDHLISSAEPVGSIYVEPDMMSLRPMQDTGPVKRAATVMARFTNEEGYGLDACPRAMLQRLVETFEKEHQIQFLIGFEIEITFCRRNASPSSPGEVFTPLDTNHAWGTFSDEQYLNSVALMICIASVLQKIGIPIQYLHSEAGAGQYEFVLPPMPPIQAVDTLVQAKQCIMQIAATKGLRATCHPMPFTGVGTAAHAHFSLNGEGASEKVERQFMAGVLDSLKGICAICMSQMESYGRVIDDGWTGGRWVAWGTNNREVPLRRVSPLRWEVRCLDGFANPYLALVTLFSAGLLGIRNQQELKMKDCLKNPSKLSEEELKDLGILEKLPTTLDESLRALNDDLELQKIMGEDLVRNWIEVKRAEQESLSEMGEGERKVWLIERY
ncbi:glutamine synthetase guanido kinase [Lecanosticta acicola]|uniref:Glutamine synthetase guanido kinase n=1 Tax=Lecanosticta acicola TaxID=111012 RepID=A0AAI9E9P5_9PEZI|nr:glutamine synthetase guanido kinase [Lecanosticta acicola]